MQINLVGFSPLAESVHNLSNFSLNSFLSSVVFSLVFLSALLLVRLGQRLSEIAIRMHICSSLIEDGKLRASGALDGDHVAVLYGEAEARCWDSVAIDAAST